MSTHMQTLFWARRTRRGRGRGCRGPTTALARASPDPPRAPLYSGRMRAVPLVIAGFLIAWSGLPVASQRSQPARYDIIITHGTVIDGSGARPIRADVAIKDGRIAAIGALTSSSAAEVIDATG